MDEDKILAAILGLRDDMGSLRVELKADMASVRSELKADMASLRSDVTGLRSEVTDLQSEVNGLRLEVIGLRSELTGLRSEVTGLKLDLKDFRSEMLSFRVVVMGKIETIENRLTRMASDLTTTTHAAMFALERKRATVSDIDWLVDMAVSMERQIKYLQTNVEDLQKRAS